jgi:small subunit ribosomal protein S6
VSRDYELGFILSPEVNEEETRAILDRIEQIVTAPGGQISKVTQWGRRRLAYPIQRHRDGYYIFTDMILTPETVAELERTLKVSEIVLRYVVRKRDARIAQKEREARATAAAAAAAAAVSGGITEEPASELVEETIEETLLLSEEEMANVPPAIEETVEA